MIEKKIVISNPTGLHARPATLFVNFVKKYACSITLKTNERSADPRSILGLLSLGLSNGKEVTICVDGEDEENIANEIAEFLANMTD